MKSLLLALIFQAGVCGVAVMAADDLTGEAFQLADQAYKAVSTGDLEQATNAVQAALQLSPEHPQLLGLLAQIQSMSQDYNAALHTLGRALAVDADNARLRAQRGFLQIQGEDYDAAREDFQAALQLEQLGLDETHNVAIALADLYARDGDYSQAVQVLAPYVAPEYREVTLKWQSYLIHTGELPTDGTLIASPEVSYALLNKAYEALQKKDDERALQLFQIAERLGGLTALQYGDAGYAARGAFNNKEADRMFRAAIDATQNEPADRKSYGPPELFGLRRAVDDLNRFWGLIISNSISPGGQTGANILNLPGFSRSGVNEGHINQLGSEIYFQPPGIGYRDGRQLQFFLRSFQTLDDTTGGAEGSETNQGSAGVRWKPLRDYNLVLTAERLFSVGDLASNDWLLRTGFSVDQGVDIRPYEEHWPYYTLFAEAAYLVNEHRHLDTFEARWGHSFRTSLPENLVLTPHLVVAGDLDTGADQETAASVGVGASARLWFRESVYRAPASYVDVTLQYRHALMDDALRQDGTFLRFTLWY